jgi:hypothetical protein
MYCAMLIPLTIAVVKYSKYEKLINKRDNDINTDSDISPYTSVLEESSG